MVKVLLILLLFTDTSCHAECIFCGWAIWLGMSTSAPARFCALLLTVVPRYDLEDLFKTFGKLRDVDLKRSGVAFIEFDDWRDCEDALQDLDGEKLKGSRIRVDIARDSGNIGKCFNCELADSVAVHVS